MIILDVQTPSYYVVQSIYHHYILKFRFWKTAELKKNIDFFRILLSLFLPMTGPLSKNAPLKSYRKSVYNEMPYLCYFMFG